MWTIYSASSIWEGWGLHICDCSISPNALSQDQSITKKGHHGCWTAAWPAGLFPLPQPTAGSWPPVSSTADSSLQREAAGKKQEPHVSTSHTQTTQSDRHNEPYLTVAHHQLLTRWNVMRFRCEHTKNTRLCPAAMWANNAFHKKGDW